MDELTGVKVMVIDDSQTITRAAAIYLSGPKDRPTGMVVRTVANGFDAIPDIMDFHPHIIFLDVMMPKIDGFTICKAIKANPSLKGIKVVMLTAKDGLFDQAKGMDAGADSYITKPFTKDVIMDVVQRYVKDIPAEARAPGAA